MIIILIAVAILVFIFIKWRFVNTSIIKGYFRKLSLMVCGKRGTGKDTLFSYITYHKPHNSNIKLQKNTNVIKLQDLLIDGLDRRSLLNGTFKKINMKDKEIFKKMTLISDAGIYFPSYDHEKLSKDYPSLPMAIALWRQLYNAPLHFNCQNPMRLWKILREQIEDVLMCRGCYFGLFYVKIKLRYYERLEDAENGLKPIKVNPLHVEEAVKVELSKRWEIKDYTILVPRFMINHDTNYFKQLVFEKDLNEKQKEYKLIKFFNYISNRIKYYLIKLKYTILKLFRGGK